jgi:hypothetical protein
MNKTIRMMLVAAGFAAALAGSPVHAQTQRIAGSIEGVDGSTLIVKLRQGGDAKVNLTDNVAVFGVVNATLADIKPGSFIGVGAAPQPDGSQKAIQVMIFSEVQRGTGEGHRPWDRPNTTMTNATVATAVAGVDGQVVMVKYKDGEKKVIITPETVIRAYMVGNRSELKPGASIMITQAVKKADGNFETNRVNVGRDGIVP